MDLELTDEQRWLSESVDTLLTRADPARVWEELVAFGALSDELGAVELCLIARALGEHLVAVPFIASAAVRFAVDAPIGEHTHALALLEPGGRWDVEDVATVLDGGVLRGEKLGVEGLDVATQLAVVAVRDTRPVLVLVDAAGLSAERQTAFDELLATSVVRFDGTPSADVFDGEDVLTRLVTIGALLAASEANGAADQALADAARYAGERRQFGVPIASFQSLRHILADMHVRQASGWSAILYAAAALDDGLPEAAQAASVAKAYVSRGAREVAHGAMQVFGGIAVTAEHPAHRFLRRIVVREQQFGDAAHHERLLGRALAARVAEPAGSAS